MKKVILSFAILAMTAIGMNAQNNVNNQNCPVNNCANKEVCVNPENCDPAKCPRPNCPKKGGQCRQSREILFEGITLTPDQKTKLDALRANNKGGKNGSESRKGNLTEEQKKQMKAEKATARRQAKKDYLNGVKEILTPDQYVVFLENFYVSGGNGHKNKGMKFEARKNFKKGHGDKKFAKVAKDGKKRDGNKPEKK